MPTTETWDEPLRYNSPETCYTWNYCCRGYSVCRRKSVGNLKYHPSRTSVRQKIANKIIRIIRIPSVKQSQKMKFTSKGTTGVFLFYLKYCRACYSKNTLLGTLWLNVSGFPLVEQNTPAGYSQWYWLCLDAGTCEKEFPKGWAHKQNPDFGQKTNKE